MVHRTAVAPMNGGSGCSGSSGSQSTAAAAHSRGLGGGGGGSLQGGRSVAAALGVELGGAGGVAGVEVLDPGLQNDTRGQEGNFRHMATMERRPSIPTCRCLCPCACSIPERTSLQASTSLPIREQPTAEPQRSGRYS